ncbi:hypothetical protein [Agaribacter marinus]|uniref:Uncharacterized protein n=1 Tax=Agaribacter marinus TaxID=1431249 RepID=A0AA37SSL5_9ALTE|nr:hypothetical protein [Agaribacter marinus]GLR69186.1 hypothetical protein GCM10007852_00940 [Agaribacter marinus]
MRLIYFLLFLSVKASATTCLITDEMQSSWNDNYASSIDLRITKIKDRSDVLVLFPEKIEDLSLSSVFLQLGNDSNPEFVSQLGIYREEEMPAVFFTMKNSVTSKGYIIAEYGADCGVQVFKEVVFSEQT